MNTSKTIKLISFLSLFLGLSFANVLHAQAPYKLAAKPEIKVTGGSTLHDWEMASAQAQGKAEITIEGTTLKAISAGSVTMKSESLKSGKDKMDGIAYESLKTKKHPDIQFTLTSYKNLDGKKGQATGNLTIAGTTKAVTFTVDSVVKGGVVTLTGETPIKFTDFNLTPPTALLGTIKTTNDLKLHFKVNFQQVNPSI
ncbi:YceI family protein [Pontibacter qinzhouensis]|uniref:YceI family protein n=1 Tax=Pontibacter qinzhouensis TaxID=2603253 RepID=A0A5C8JJF1_9BACT|nr:YceI family protein [Pontibacter qinzhouensis]TXK37481.1 YceI family protein [Pontibacter qinzhouensis]